MVNTFLLILLCQFISNYGISYGCTLYNTDNKTDTRTDNKVSHDMKLVCYYGSWAVYRPEDGKYPVENIDPHICTHLIYAFAGLGYDNRIRSLDPYYDLEENYGKAIGGWNEGSIKYSNMASMRESRKVFIDSVIEFIKKYGFDGLDLDWEYPAARGGKPEDKQNFAALLRELSEAFKQSGFILTAAVSAGKWFVDPGYDVPALGQYLDIINIMCYDYHGGWDNKTGHNAPMYARPSETDLDKISNVNYSINYWISQGAPRNKIALGMGTYGRSFTLDRAEKNTLDAPSSQKGLAGPYTREPGNLGYNEICEMRMREKWTQVDDPYTLAPYIFRDRQWVGYDDVASLTIKAEYIKSMKLAGGMVWSIETDDFHGKCHNGEKYPLLKAINKAFERDISSPPTPGTPTPTTASPSPSPSPSPTPAPSPIPPQSPSSPTPHTPSTSTPWDWPSPSHSPATKPSVTPPEKPTPIPSVTPSATPSVPPSSPPSSPPSPPKLECTEEGMFRHPTDCQRFYRCVQDHTQGKYRLYEYTCPEGTAFDNDAKLCTWRDSVKECSPTKFTPFTPKKPEREPTIPEHEREREV